MKNALTFLFSFLITLVYYIPVLIILVYTMDAKGYSVEDIPPHISLWANLPISVLLTAIAIKLKTGLYKECFSPVVMFLFTLIFGPVGMIFSLAGLLKVKFGDVTLKAPQ